MKKQSSVPESFWNEIRGRNERLPVWFPGTPMELGDVGRFTGSGWTKFTTLSKLGVSAASDQDGALGDFEYASHEGVHRTAALSPANVDAVVVAGRGDVTYRFEREGSFVIRATGATVRRLADLLAVEDQVLDLYRRGEWRRDWTVVTEVVVSGPNLVLVSAGSEAAVTVRMSGSTTALPGVTASAAVRYRVENDSNMAAAYGSEERTTLFWRGFYVADPLFRKARFTERGDQEPREPAAPTNPDMLPSEEPYCEEVQHLMDVEALAEES